VFLYSIPLTLNTPFLWSKKGGNSHETMVSKEMFNMNGGRDILGYQAILFG
jgi:hypothetical protein